MIQNITCGEDIQKIINFSVLGWSSRKISKELGLGRISVERVIDENKFLSGLTPSLELKIMSTYEDIKDIFKLAKKLLLEPSLISYVVYKFNKEIFNEELVSKLYDSGLSLHELSTIFQCSISSVRKNIPDDVIRDQLAAFVDDDYFSKINSANKAYWLGFIFADGWITSSGKILGIKLASIDKEHLEKLSIDLEYAGSIYDYSCTTNYGPGNYAILTIVSRKMNNDLYNLGCTPTKTTSAEGPDINSTFHKDFIRGIIDGDGSYSKNKKRISFSGTRAMVDWVSKNSIVAATKPSQVAANTWTIYWHGNKADQMFHWMFDDAERYLTRKYDIVKEVFK